MRSPKLVTPLPTTSTLTLSDLAELSFGECERRYRAGVAPTSMTALDGPLIGRMLAVRGIASSPLGEPVRRWAASRSFVWGGKTFTAEDARRGRGINRVSLPGVLGRQDLFPFETRFDGSVLDGGQTVVLDYDLPQNPPYIRRIHDEVREVAPGLYLGPAMWKGEGTPVTVLWFGLAVPE